MPDAEDLTAHLDEYSSEPRLSETGKGRVRKIPRGDNSWQSYSNHWHDNHGSLLMAFAGIILLIGGGVLFYQQNRFRPPAFPPAAAIMRPEGARSSEAESDVPPSLPAEDSFELIISGTADTSGVIRVAIYGNAKTFNDSEKSDWKSAVSVEASGVTSLRIPLQKLPDEFAVAVYHDVNSNGKLDRNALGIPSERYGFSREARGKLGPPQFQQAVMKRPLKNGSIELAIW